jgi:FG-GAP-like repeat
MIGVTKSVSSGILALVFCLGLTAREMRAQGQFGPPTYYGSGDNYNLIADFNNDGFPDVASLSGGSSGNGHFGVYLNQGDGSLKADRSYAVGVEPLLVVAGDLNNDGNLDLVIANTRSNFFSVALGNGDGTFNRGLNIETPRFGASYLAARGKNSNFAGSRKSWS